MVKKIEEDIIDPDKINSKIVFKINGKEFFIRSDDMQWYLSAKIKFVDKKTGEAKEKWDNVGYYSNLNQALEGAFEKKLRNSQYQSFNELVQNCAEIKKEMTGYYNAYNAG